MLKKQPFSQEVIDTYRGWDILARSQGNPAVGIVDIDVAPKNSPTEFFTLEDVNAKFKELLEDLPNDEKNKRFLEKKLKASLIFSGVLMRKEVELREYVEGTMGVHIDYVPEETLDALRNDLGTLLSEKGIEFTPGGKEKFDSTFVITDSGAIKKGLDGEMAWAKTAVADYIDIAGGEVVPEIVDVEESWAGWLGADSDGEVFMKVNINKRFPQTVAKFAVLAAHEYAGHAVHVNAWKQGIEAGDINPAVGLITFHGPECTQFEAVAQGMEHLLLRGRSWEHDFETRHTEYRGMVYHNAHIMINEGVSEQEVINYARERMPFEPIGQIEASVKDRRDDPTIRTYFACYEPALELVRPLLTANADHQKKTLGRLYNQPLTPAEIEVAVATGW